MNALEVARRFDESLRSLEAALIPVPRKPDRSREIPVTELRIGMTLAGKGGTKVRTIDPCTTRGKVHVNTTQCYDLCGYIEVAR